MAVPTECPNCGAPAASIETEYEVSKRGDKAKLASLGGPVVGAGMLVFALVNPVLWIPAAAAFAAPFVVGRAVDAGKKATRHRCTYCKHIWPAAP